MKVSFVLPVVLTLLTASTSAIDCSGSKKCQIGGCQLSELIRKIPNGKTWKSGKEIACCEGRGNRLCATATHAVGDLHSDVVKVLLQELYNYGCRRCGDAYSLVKVNAY
ncbi:hypothetical protein GX50_03265 [[Emmonsia] crescens]|uniref:Killer toxin Kp4 domain-containing protein n=1 Tax=[Emmonsia] crescens TaxID=73230 RepID=A0A2B7ZBW0_9EURO|nr:hypothetical protein GX50_03265 [Emmonsia crescens]